LEWPGKDEAKAGDGIALPQRDVGGKVSSGPALKQRGCVGAEFLEQIAQCKAFLRVERKILHESHSWKR
jgi:hypothetical protein